MFPGQTTVVLDMHQGEDPDALKNVPVGSFRITGLTPNLVENEVLSRMSLDLDGVVRVTMTEKQTGLSREIQIENALAQKRD